MTDVLQKGGGLSGLTAPPPGYDSVQVPGRLRPRTATVATLPPRSKVLPKPVPAAAIASSRPLSWLLDRLPPALAGKGGDSALRAVALQTSTTTTLATEKGHASSSADSEQRDVIVYGGGLLPSTAPKVSFTGSGLYEENLDLDDAQLEDCEGEGEDVNGGAEDYDTIVIFDPAQVRVQFAVQITWPAIVAPVSL